MPRAHGFNSIHFMLSILVDPKDILPDKINVGDPQGDDLSPLLLSYAVGAIWTRPPAPAPMPPNSTNLLIYHFLFSHFFLFLANLYQLIEMAVLVGRLVLLTAVVVVLLY